MSNKVPFSYDGNVITLVLGNRAVNVPNSHPNINEIKLALKNGLGASEIEAIVNRVTPGGHTAETMVSGRFGKITVVNNIVQYNGVQVEDVHAKRILTLIRADLPTAPAERFLEKLLRNKSFKSRQHVDQFLEHRHLALCDDGDFFAYKAVDGNFMDKWTHKIDNHPGRIVSMDRSLVDDDSNRRCSKGLHVGALDYVYGYASGDDRMIIIKVNPEDVVSVPNDSQCQKMRVCKYEVVQEYKGELQQPLYTASAESYTDDDYEEDDYDDDEWIRDLEEDDDTGGDDDRYEASDVKSCCKDEEKCPCKERYFAVAGQLNIVAWVESPQGNYWLHKDGRHENSVLCLEQVGYSDEMTKEYAMSLVLSAQNPQPSSHNKRDSLGRFTRK